MSRRSLALALAMCLATVLTFAQTPVPSATDAEQKTLEEYMKMVRGDITARRDSAIATLLEMNDTERKAFGPLRQAYDKELAAIGKRRVDLMQEYMKVHTKLTPDTARRLFAELHRADEDRLALRKKYFDLISKEVSPVVAAQFLQLERQFETMGDLKIATRMPLAVR
jgi:hypothetical protein